MPKPGKMVKWDVVPQCHAKLKVTREWLLQGTLHPGPAVVGENPNRVLARYMHPVVNTLLEQAVELDEYLALLRHAPDVALFMYPYLAPLIAAAPSTYPGGGWLTQWNWSGAQDLTRLIKRLEYYKSVTDSVEGMSDEEQRAILAPNVFNPIFLGLRRKVLDDPNSPVIQTRTDFCETALISRNFDYALDLDLHHTGMATYLSIAADEADERWEDVKDIVEQTARGLKKLGGGLMDLAPLAVLGLAFWGIGKVAGAAKRRQ